MAKWSYEMTHKFIQHYKANQCLWNVSDKHYNDKKTREAAYIYLAEIMAIPNFNVNDVKNKIKNLRSTYMQEVKKIRDAKLTGGERESSLKWLSELEPVFEGARLSEKNKSLENNSLSEQSSSEQAKRTRSTSEEPTAPRKRTKNNFKVKIKKPHDEAFEAFGRSVVMQLKTLPHKRALRAQCQIQTILTEHGIAYWTEMHSQSNSTVQFVDPESCDLSDQSPTSCSMGEVESEEIYGLPSSPEQKVKCEIIENTLPESMPD